MQRNKPELLSPAGNPEKMKVALLYGADAVYLGGKSFGLRAMGGNFSRAELQEAMEFAHGLGKKVYVTVNIFPHNADLADLPDYLRFLRDIDTDALLVADLGVFQLAREVVPELPLHVSTQANNVNYLTAEAWRKLGAERVVLARELSLGEVAEIRKHTETELELFVHGAMCISYSGRCLLSNYFTGRDANRGACVQSCRWQYALTEASRPGEYFPIEEDERGTYIMNSKDLCLLPYLPQVIESGADSLKIEGRMKSVHYVASVTKAYREAIDSYWAAPEQFEVRQEWLDELEKVSHRPYTSGFALAKPTADSQVYSSSSYLQTSDFVGLVLGYDEKTGYATVEQRNNMKCGQELEFFCPQGQGFRQLLADMLDSEGQPIEVAPHAQQVVKIRVDKPVEPYTILRRDV